MPEERVVEVKRKLDGSEQRFDCELVQRTREMAVVRFHFDGTRHPSFGGVIDSYGVFWRRRPYSCYYMVRSEDGAELVTRFDIVREVELHVPGEVRWTDLLLDLWVEGGMARWEDEDEVEAATAGGLLTSEDVRRIARGRGVLERGYPRVVAEIRTLLRSLGRIP